MDWKATDDHWVILVRLILIMSQSHRLNALIYILVHYVTLRDKPNKNCCILHYNDFKIKLAKDKQ